MEKQQYQREHKEEDNLLLLLKSSLESNLVLQQSIQKQIHSIHTNKINNRLSVIQLTSKLQQQQQGQQQEEEQQQEVQHRQYNNSNSNSNSNKNDVLLQKIQKQCNTVQTTINTTAMNSNRSKWTRRFFYYSNDNTANKLNELDEPYCNNDTLQRRQYYKQNFYSTTTPPWSKKESLLLQTIIQNHINSTMQTKNLDFTTITQQYNEQINNNHHHTSTTCFSEKKMMKQQQPIVYIHRTINECTVRYIELQLLLQRQHQKQQSSTKWTIDESKLLQDIVMTQQQQLHNTSIQYVDWDIIAKVFCQSQSLKSVTLVNDSDRVDNNNSNNNNNDNTTISNKKRKLNNNTTTSNSNTSNIVIPYRLGYECMKQYQHIITTSTSNSTNNSNSSSSCWTIIEDTILLKLVSLYGTQYNMDGKAIDLHLLPNILPLHHKTKHQLLFRCNNTLLNPKLNNTGWTVDDERKLVVLMKLYSNNNDNNTINDIYLSALHYKDTKSIKSVIDKWNRTLNPNYTLQSYSIQEDELLHSIIQNKINEHKQQQQSKYNNSKSIIPTTIISWTQIQEQYFPNRHPQRLCDHYYNTIASNSDIVQLYCIRNK